MAPDLEVVYLKPPYVELGIVKPYFITTSLRRGRRWKTGTGIVPPLKVTRRRQVKTAESDSGNESEGVLLFK